MYLTLKLSHVCLAALAIGGFVLRGYWLANGSRLSTHRATKIVPHILDTLFLATGIALLGILSLNPFNQAWLLAKFAGLFAYVVCGMIAFRPGRTAGTRIVAFIAAVASFAYVVGAALSKSALSWLAF